MDAFIARADKIYKLKKLQWMTAASLSSNAAAEFGNFSRLSEREKSVKRTNHQNRKWRRMENRSGYYGNFHLRCSD